MTREERAELTIRVAGIVFLTGTLGGLVPLVGFTQMLRPGVYAVPGALAGAITSLAYTLTGYGFVFWPRRVAVLLRPRPEQEEGHEEELLRAGVFVLGVYYAFRVFLMATIALTDSEATGAGFDALFTALATALFLARPRRLIVWFARRARAGAQDGGLGGLVGSGIALVAVAMLMQSLSKGLVKALSSPPPPAPPALARLMALMAGLPARAYVAAASGVALSLLALALCGRIGRWLARGAGETPLAVAARMGKRDWVVLGMVCVPLYGALEAFLVPDVLYPRELPVPYVLVQAMVLFGLPVLAALVARPIARRLYPEGPDQPGSRAGLVVALETTMTLLILYCGLGALVLAGMNRAHYLRHVGPILLLLALRGDVARWYAWPPAAPEDAKPALAANLHPWLGLLGAYLLLLNLRGLPGLVATALGWIATPTVLAVAAPPMELSWPVLVPPVAGLALVLAARPFARLLAYGPLLGPLLRAFWRPGWARRPGA